MHTFSKLLRTGTHIEIDIQTDRQTDRQTNRQTGGRTDRQTDRQTDGQTDGRTDRQASKDTHGELTGMVIIRMIKSKLCQVSSKIPIQCNSDRRPHVILYFKRMREMRDKDREASIFCQILHYCVN